MARDGAGQPGPPPRPSGTARAEGRGRGEVGLSGLLSAAPPLGGLRAADPGCAAREPGGWRRPQLRSCGRAPGRPAARGAPVPAALAGPARGCSCFCPRAEVGRRPAEAQRGTRGVWERGRRPLHAGSHLRGLAMNDSGG